MERSGGRRKNEGVLDAMRDRGKQIDSNGIGQPFEKEKNVQSERPRNSELNHVDVHGSTRPWVQVFSRVREFDGSSCACGQYDADSWSGGSGSMYYLLGKKRPCSGIL